MSMPATTSSTSKEELERIWKCSAEEVLALVEELYSIPPEDAERLAQFLDEHIVPDLDRREIAKRRMENIGVADITLNGKHLCICTACLDTIEMLYAACD